MAYKVSVDTETEELELYQPNSCFYYSINDQGSRELFVDQLLPIVRTSFEAWENVTGSYFYFEATDPPYSSVDRAEFNQDKGNVNLLVWHKDYWEELHDDPDSPNPYTPYTIALASVVYDVNTGDILDADIEFNNVHFSFGDAESSGTADIVDLQTVITHEIGHTIGLADLKDPAFRDSTMYGVDIHNADGSPSTDKRDLAEDDELGLRYLYPENENPMVCNEPVCGLDLDGTTTSCKDDGCQVASTCRSGNTGCQTVSSGLRQPDSLITFLLHIL